MSRQSDASPETPEPQPPLLRVVRGTPSDEELAALVTVVASLAAGATAGSRPTARPEWNTLHRLVRPPLHAGPGAWRSSGLPTR